MTLNAELLHEENRQLREALLPPMQYKFPREWKLSRSETAFLQCLYSAPNHYRSTVALHTASNLSGIETDSKIVAIWASKIRKKLRPFGIEMTTVWGYGYELTPASVQTIRQAAAQ